MGAPSAGLATWWLAGCGERLPARRDWLSESERGQAERLRFTKRREDFLLSRWTMKAAVARLLGWPQAAATLARIESRPVPGGAPRLFVDGHPAPWGISLSDRAGCAVCLIAARAVAVGCDIEVIESRSNAFVRDYLTEAERDLVRLAHPAADLAANLIWSAKESALKVLGSGLRKDTRSVEVAVRQLDGPERVWSALLVRTEDGDVFPGWWRRSGAFVLTACWAGGGSPPVALETRSPVDTTPPSHRWLERPVS